MTWRHHWHIKITRDALLFVVGLALLWHETFVVSTAEPVIVAAAVAFLGSPLFLRLDEANRGTKEEAKKQAAKEDVVP